MKKSLFLRIFVTLFFISMLYLSFGGEMGEIAQTLKRVDLRYFLLGLLLQLAIICIISLRLRLIFKTQGLLLSLKETVELSFLGIFFNNFLPTAVGGDLPKAYYAYKKTRKKMESFACVIGDRVIGLFSMVLFASLGVFFLWQELNRPIKTAVGSLFIFSFFLISLLFNHHMAKSVKFLFTPFKKIGWDREIEAVYRFLQTLSGNKKLLFQALLISMVCHVMAVSSAYFLIRGLSASFSFIKLFVILPLIIALSMLPSLNGLGIREGAFVYFLGGGIGTHSAFALSILWLAILGIQSIIGGIYYLHHGWRRVSLKEVEAVKSP